MRTTVITLLLMALAIPCVNARRPRKRAGEIDDDVYMDKTYAFQLELQEGWKVKVNKQSDNFRLVMLQESYEIPPDYMEAPDYTQVPRLVVWADTTHLGAFAFMDSLLSETFDSKQKDDVLKEFEILQPAIRGSGSYRDPTVTKSRKAIKIGEDRAALWTGQATYMKEVAESASAIGGKRVNGAYGGAVVAIKHDHVLVAFHLIAEWQFFNAVLEEVMPMIESLQWPEPEKPEPAVEDKG